MISPFLETSPSYDDTNYIAPNATVIGDVTLGRYASVWFGVVLRGDVNWIRIGDETNIQDNSVVHVTNRTGPTLIGRGVTVGHSVVLHGCTLGDNILVGIGSIVLDDVVVGNDTIIGARSLLTPGTSVPPRSPASELLAGWSEA